MPTVLVDTAAWIAFVNTRDELHPRASANDGRTGSWQPRTIDDGLCAPRSRQCSVRTSAWRAKAVKLIDGFRALPDLRIIVADTILLAQGWLVRADRIVKHVKSNDEYGRL